MLYEKGVRVNPPEQDTMRCFLTPAEHDRIDADSGDTALKLAPKWDSPWSIVSNAPHAARRSQVRLDSELVEVVRLGHGEPVVLVPGLAGSWKLTLPLARRLARHFEVITYGLRGDSVHSTGNGRVWDIGGHAEDLAQVIDQLGLERPTVIGVSFGGAIALELAVEHSSRLSSLIVQGADARFCQNIGATIARRVLERFPLPANNRFVNQFFNLLHGTKPEPGPLVDFIAERIWETDQSIIAQRLAQLERFDVSDRLWSIDVPTLVLAGSKDAIIKPSRQKALAQSIPGARLEMLEGAGHIGFLTHRAEITRRIVRHLRRIKSVV